EALWNGGRLFYVGAGTSGRLGVLDAAEAPPTFGVPPDKIIAIIAGGTKALTRSVEGAEDNEKAGAKNLRKYRPSKKDVVLGISSGATTPYVHAALKEAKRRSLRTIWMVCTPVAERPPYVDVVISLLTGPEVITGSTRMKAGSATKMVLNMIST